MRSIYEAAKREVYEESGVSNIVLENLHQLYVNIDVSPRDHIAFLTAHTMDVPSLTRNIEIQQVDFFSVDDLPVDVDASVCRRLQEISQENFEATNDTAW